LWLQTPRGPAVRDLPDLIAGLQGGEIKMKNTSDTLIRSAHVRLDEAEDAGFQQLVESLETTRSRLLRKIIRESIGEGPDLLPQEMKPFEEAVFQLAALGRNLNQLLKLVHSGQINASSQDLALMEGIRTQVELLKKETLTVIDRSRERWVRHAA